MSEQKENKMFTKIEVNFVVIIAVSIIILVYIGVLLFNFYRKRIRKFVPVKIGKEVDIKFFDERFWVKTQDVFVSLSFRNMGIHYDPEKGKGLRLKALVSLPKGIAANAGEAEFSLKSHLPTSHRELSLYISSSPLTGTEKEDNVLFFCSYDYKKNCSDNILFAVKAIRLKGGKLTVKFIGGSHDYLKIGRYPTGQEPKDYCIFDEVKEELTK